MDYKKFEKYIKGRRGKKAEVSIPEVQREFGWNYREVKLAFDTAVSNDLLTYKSGIVYEINKNPPPKKSKRSYERGKFMRYFGAPAEKEEKRESGELENRVKDFAAERQTISVPLLQQKFNLDYAAAIKIIRELVEDEIIKFSGGIDYEVLPREEKTEDEDTARTDGLTPLQKHFEELRKSREELIRRLRMEKYEDEDGDDDENEEEDDGGDNPDGDNDSGNGDDNGGEGGGSGGEQDKLGDGQFISSRCRPHTESRGWARFYSRREKDGEGGGSGNGCSDGNSGEDYDSVKLRLLEEEIRRQREEKEQDGQAPDDNKFPAVPLITALKIPVSRLVRVLTDIAVHKEIND